MQANTGGTQVLRCSVHTNARAAWNCPNCGKDLCPGCAAADSVQNTTLVRCVHCGGVGEVLTVQKAPQPWWEAFPVFFKALFSLRGLGQYLIIGLCLVGAGFIFLAPLIGWILGLIIYFGIYAGWLFTITNAFATGEEELPPLENMGRELGDVFFSALRFLLATAIVWAPLLIYVFSSFGMRRMVAGDAFTLSDPVILIIGLIGLVYIPAAFVVAALSDSVGDVLNPMGILSIAAQVPKQYIGVAIFCAVALVANQFLDYGLKLALFSGGVRGLMAAIGLGLLVISATLMLPALIAMVLGRFIHQNAEAFDFPGGTAVTVPAVPGAKPRAELPPDGWKKKERQAVKQPEALELESTPDEALAGAIKVGNDGVAMEAYGKIVSSGGTPNLHPETELLLARVLDKAGDPMGAAHACRRAAQKDLQGPLAPKALYTAARLLTEKVGAKDDGRKLFEYLIANFPDHELTAKAKALLAALG